MRRRQNRRGEDLGASHSELDDRAIYCSEPGTGALRLRLSSMR